MIAPLHESHATEPTPVFYEALRAHNLAAVTRDVRTGLADVTPLRPRLTILNGGIGVRGAVTWNA